MADIDSVYELVTKLCESQLTARRKLVDPKIIKKLRSKAFEILLYKQQLIEDPYWLNNNNDYNCQFIGWVYILRNTYNQNKMADEVEDCVRTITASNYDTHTINRIFHVLLKLKRPPRHLQPEMYGWTDSKFTSHVNTNSATLHESMKNFDNKKFSSGTFLITSSHSKFFSPEISQDYLFAFGKKSRVNAVQENTILPNRMLEANVWEVTSKEKRTKRRTWESLGNSTPLVEKPFMSEANIKIYHTLEVMAKIREMNRDEYTGYLEEENVNNLIVLTRKEYMRDLRFLVVGIQSKTFIEENETFYINGNILFEGISSGVFKQYASLMINVGICYKSLVVMVDEQSKCAESKGFVYNEFYNAVNRYLIFYRSAAVNLPPSKGIIQFHAHIRKLSLHLFTVADICKLGKFDESNDNSTIAISDNNETNTNGSTELLNLLFRKVFTQTNNNVLLVLHALLFPCLQIYFIKYLIPWIYQGVIDDPHEEFFIRKNFKYLSIQQRTYWTKSFWICSEAVPDFCFDYAERILDCGQVSNLFRTCMPTSNIFKHAKTIQNQCIAQCCINEDQLIRLENAIQCYELDVIEEYGIAFCMKRMLEMKHDEELLFNNFLAVRKAASVKRIQMEKLAKLTKIHTNSKEFNDKKTNILQRESEHIITYYENLAKKACKLDTDITNHNDTMKSFSLDQLLLVPPSEAAKPLRNTQNNLKMSKVGNQECKQNSKTTKVVKEIETKSALEKNKMNVRAVEYDIPIPKVINASSDEYFDCSENKTETMSPKTSEDSLIYLNTTYLDCDETEPQTSTKHDYIKQPKFELTKLDSKNSNLKCVSEIQDDSSPMRIPQKEVDHTQFNFMNNYVSQSITFPLKAQKSIMNAGVLKHFVVDLKYLSHLENLQKFYFLLDGGFSRIFTNELFKRILEPDPGKYLFNQQILNEVMYHAKQACTTPLDEKQVITLEYIPKPLIPHLSDVYIFDSVAIHYEVQWPLNILLSTKVMSRYNEINQFLIKIHRVSWVLRRVFIDMKNLRKQFGHQALFLSLSDQFQKLQLWRHVMTHFVHVFRNYITVEVLENCWNNLQTILYDVDDFDDLYNAHKIYLRQVYFLCLLHQKTVSVSDIIMNIFGILLKFYDYMRSKEWEFVNDEFVHPNFLKMQCIFENFTTLVNFFVKMCRRIGRSGNQPQFTMLIDLLDFNEFYTKQLNQ